MSTTAAFAILGAILAFILSFFAHSFAVFLALVVIVLAIITLVRARGGRPGKGEGIFALVTAVLALIIGSALSSDTQQGFQQATAPVDPNALPATVTIATVQSADNLVTTTGRRLHVTMMQGQGSADACRTGADTTAASRLVTGRQVAVAAPDAAHTDTPTAVPAGFQSVVMTLPDGRDYAQTWQGTAAETWAETCRTAEPTTTTEAPVPTTTTEATSEPDVDVDADRPYVPAPKTKARSGHSGHPCLPGERDGDGDGYCGE